MKRRLGKKKDGSDSARVGKGDVGEGKTSVPKVESRKTLVKRGYAKRGDLIATMEPAVFGKDGKNVLGETVPARKVQVLRLVPGLNVTVEKGTRFFMRTTGVVEVMKDVKGTFHIQGRMYHCGQCSVAVSNDEMSAALSIVPSIGGARQISVDDVLGELNKQGVSFGIDQLSIEEAVATVQEKGESIDDLIVARGDEPEHGKDGTLELQVIWASGSAVKVRGNGRADFKDLDRVTSVNADQLVAFMTRETPGQEDGHTVKGEVVKAHQGKPVDIELGSNIRVEDKGERVEYYAKINGQLVMDERKMSVEPVLVIEGDVGPKTGNIKFSGIVHIKGSVQDTFNVFAKKDIVVGGNVGNAVIQTDGNLEVKGGIVGKNKGLVQVGGDVRAKFAENANIQAWKDIHIQRAALNCKMSAGSRIVALQEKGQIIGGEIRAGEGIEVKVLGNESEHRMEVHVGSDFSLQARIEEIQMKIQKYEGALKKILLVLEKLKKVNPDPAGLPDNLKKLYQDTRKKGTVAKIAINELKTKESEMVTKFEEFHDAEIIVKDALFRGVKIHFGKSIYEPESRDSNVKITFNRKKDSVEVERIL
jgi:uncharacterized protein (DUF342 family)